jgi:protein gp37
LPDWVIDIKKQCTKNKVAFFFKQWGGTNKKRTGRLLNGRTYDGMPKYKMNKSRQIRQVA